MKKKKKKKNIIKYLYCGEMKKNCFLKKRYYYENLVFWFE